MMCDWKDPMRLLEMHIVENFCKTPQAQTRHSSTKSGSGPRILKKALQGLGRCMRVWT